MEQCLAAQDHLAQELKRIAAENAQYKQQMSMLPPSPPHASPSLTPPRHSVGRGPCHSPSHGGYREMVSPAPLVFPPSAQQPRQPSSPLQPAAQTRGARRGVSKREGEAHTIPPDMRAGLAHGGQLQSACQDMLQVAEALMGKVDQLQLSPQLFDSASQGQRSPSHGGPRPRASPVVDTSHSASPQRPPPQSDLAAGSPTSGSKSRLQPQNILEAVGTLKHLVQGRVRQQLSQAEFDDLGSLRVQLTTLLDGPGVSKCWICGEADLAAMLPVVCDEVACRGRVAHTACLQEWVAMMDGNPIAKFCAACGKPYTLKQSGA